MNEYEEKYKGFTLKDLNKASIAIAVRISKAHPNTYKSACARDKELQYLNKLIKEVREDKPRVLAEENAELKMEIQRLKAELEEVSEDLKAMTSEYKEASEEVYDLEQDLKREEERAEEAESELEKFENKKPFPYLTVADQMKADLLLEKWDSFKLEDLDKFFEGI